ncbi:armadillo-type protein [Pilobolus umbonatus]|nr:armadillo-type protein [Pilobolus umbonatus]
MSVQDERIAYFTTLCEEFFNPKSSNERDQIQNILECSFPTFSLDSSSLQTIEGIPSFGIQTPTDTASALRVLLENSPNPYVQMFALARLKQLIMTQFTIFDTDTKLQLRTFLLEYAYIHPDLQSFVIIQLGSVLALLTRFGWLDHKDYQNVYQDMSQFLQASAEHRIVGIQILSIIVQDVNTTSLPKFSAKFRKAATGLRDTQLLDIFEKAFLILKGLLNHTIPFDKPDQENRTKDVTLNLLLKCLSYDFAGTNLDEAGEDTGMVQIPSAWKTIYEKDEFVPTFFKAYNDFEPPYCSKVMECLVQIAATRKALFTGEEERSKFVLTIMQGIREIALSSHGLSDPDSFNGFCRLLQRFRTSAPLNEMAEKPGYMEWMGLIADFTQKAFQNWTPTSTCFYLLNFWSKIVQNMAYFQQVGDEPLKKLENITVELTRTFIATQIENVPVIIEEMLDDPLEEDENLIETLNMLGQIARCQYERSSAALIDIFDPIANRYQELINQASMGTVSGESLREAMLVFESQFSWLVYFMAVFVGSRPAYLNSDECDAVDGELTTKVIQLMEVNQSLVQGNSVQLNEKLDSGIIYFFSQFRKSYVGESNDKLVYKKLNDVFGMEGQTDMLNLIVRKIITNLQCWGESQILIRKTLELFNDLASGYSALKSLREIETTTLIMHNHLSNEFSFFNNDNHRQSRMLYYRVLCKILFAEENCENEFYEFMKPFEIRLERLSMFTTLEEFRQPDVHRALQDIFRDLRAFISPIQSRRNYLMFFNWFYPDYMPVLLRGLQAWAPDPSVNSLLKFFAEFVHNKSQRLTLDISSVNGVLLFRDASQIICTYGQSVIGQLITDENRKYPLKYKGISSCFNILGRCLGGKYINFSIFWLYQDKAINDVFAMMFRLMLSIPLDDMMNFPKLARTYFMMMDEFSVEQMMIDPEMPAEAFLYILESCEQGVESTDASIRTHACSAINNICTFVIQETKKAELHHLKENDDMLSLENGNDGAKKKYIRRTRFSLQGILFLNYLNQFPQVLRKLLTTLFGMILFDDNNDQWQLSKPLYTLVLLQREFASKYTNQVILQQLPERREIVTKVSLETSTRNGLF